jgi:2-polyprenyl-6-methoxyphenol hydroxylase-like FAD-dependent oxidoreductase
LTRELLARKPDRDAAVFQDLASLPRSRDVSPLRWLRASSSARTMIGAATILLDPIFQGSAISIGLVPLGTPDYRSRGARTATDGGIVLQMADTDLARIPIAIVGGGPVGLMLALFLDFHGVRSVLFNSEPGTRWHPKGSTESSRTMEHFRRLGIAADIRKLGLPAGHPTDVAYFTRFGGAELARLRMPSASEIMRLVAEARATDQVPEPIHRANQMYVERFLFAHAKTRPNIVMRFGWRVERFEQDVDGVGLTAVREPEGTKQAWRADYLVGCDGGRSLVRRALGIRFRGEAGLEQRYFGGRMFSTYVRAPALYREFLGHRRAWQYWAVNPDIRSSLIAVNGSDEFLFRTRASEPDKPPEDAAVADAMRRCVGASIAMEIVAHEPWTAGMALVAERFADRRVFLAGDAIHLFTPTGGFGMNTGIDDAANLAWKLAAATQGWGGRGLPESYEIERMPIALRNTEAARRLTENIGETDIDPAIEQDTPAGAAARRAAGAMLGGFGEQFASLGVQLGARYDGSPIIAADGAPPLDDLVAYVPTSVPGGRAPHLWLGDERTYGGSLYDRLGNGFTLLRLGSRPPDVSTMATAAARRKIPLVVLDVAAMEARDLYGCDLALIRPDQYVAWRGNRPPADADRVLAQMVGFAG